DLDLRAAVRVTRLAGVLGVDEEAPVGGDVGPKFDADGEGELRVNRENELTPGADAQPGAGSADAERLAEANRFGMEVDRQLDLLPHAVVVDLDAAEIDAGACRQFLDQVLHGRDLLDDRRRVGDGAEDRVELMLQSAAPLNRERGVRRVGRLGGGGVEANDEPALGNAVNRAQEACSSSPSVGHAVAGLDALQQQIAILKIDREILEAAVAEDGGDIDYPPVARVRGVVAELERLGAAAEQVPEALVDQRDFRAQQTRAGKGLDLTGNTGKPAEDLGRGNVLEEVKQVGVVVLRIAVFRG